MNKKYRKTNPDGFINPLMRQECLPVLCHSQTLQDFQGRFKRNAHFLLFEGIDGRSADAGKDRQPGVSRIKSAMLL